MDGKRGGEEERGRCRGVSGKREREVWGCGWEEREREVWGCEWEEGEGGVGVWVGRGREGGVGVWAGRGRERERLGYKKEH